MDDLWIGASMLAAIFGGMTFWLFHNVKECCHPARSVLAWFLITFFSMGILVVSILLLSAAAMSAIGAGKVGVWFAIGTILGAVAAWWSKCEKWMGRAPSGRKIKFPAVHKIVVNSYMPWLAATVAVGSFFFIHGYNPKFGIVGTAMRGEIYVMDKTAVATPSDPFADLVPDPAMKIPYRYILVGCLCMAGINLGARKRARPRTLDEESANHR